MTRPPEILGGFFWVGEDQITGVTHMRGGVQAFRPKWWQLRRWYRVTRAWLKPGPLAT